MRNLAPGDLVKKAWDLCNQDWPGCSIMNMMHWKVIVFWGGPYRFTAFRACPMSFSTPPTKLVFAYFDRGSCIYTSQQSAFHSIGSANLIGGIGLRLRSFRASYLNVKLMKLGIPSWEWSHVFGGIFVNFWIDDFLAFPFGGICRSFPRG